jgi:hypothetical protein
MYTYVNKCCLNQSALTNLKAFSYSLFICGMTLVSKLGRTLLSEINSCLPSARSSRRFHTIILNLFIVSLSDLHIQQAFIFFPAIFEECKSEHVLILHIWLKLSYLRRNTFFSTLLSNILSYSLRLCKKKQVSTISYYKNTIAHLCITYLNTSNGERMHIIISLWT